MSSIKETFQVNGMTCSGCVNTVKKLLSNVKGVQDAQVSLSTKTAEITRDENVSIDALKIALRGFPYEIVERH